MGSRPHVVTDKNHLILHRTPKNDYKKGIPVMARGEGVYVFDAEGKRYLDLNAGMTRPVHVGYGRKEIAQTVYDQICELAYYTPRQFASEPAVRLAEMLAEITPAPINQFLFECGGSDAVDSAMKLAKHYHYFKGDKARYKVVSRIGAYHGVNGIGIRALGFVMPMRLIMEPVAPGGVFAESPYCYRCPYRLAYPDCDIICARAVERMIEFENPELISAFIGEPLQQAFGAYAPPPEYWPIVREICDRYGIVLIIDEVICGFGRTGKMFAVEHFGIQPDMLTMAKGLTSGYLPLGAVGCSDKIVEPVDMFYHLHTYGNHPVSCAAAVKNIQILIEEKLVEKAEELGSYFLQRLRELEDHPSVGEVRGTGLWLAIDFTPDKQKRTPFPMERLVNMVVRAREMGVMTNTIGSALEFAPPLIIGKEEIDEAVRVLDACITREEKDMGL